MIDRIPLNGTFELTARCNLECKMCMIRIDHRQMSELGGRERTFKEWVSMAHEVKEAGTLGLLLTGGEPLLRPDFADIYRAIAKMGFILTLYTNATMITPEIFKVLKEYPPHRVGVTVYGASADSYKKVTGSEEAYERMLEGVQLLQTLPSILSIRTTIIKDNRKDLNQIVQWARSLGSNVEFNLSRIVTKPVRGGIAQVEESRLTPEENAAMIKERNMEIFLSPLKKFITENKFHKCNREEVNSEEVNNKDADYDTSGSDKDKLSQSLYGCDAGMNSYTITWDGRLIGCQMLEDHWTYPFQSGFLQAWEEFPLHTVPIRLPKECIGCEISCCACPATRMAETGSMSGWPKYLCREGKLSKLMEEEVIAELENIMKEGLIDANI